MKTKATILFLSLQFLIFVPLASAQQGFQSQPAVTQGGGFVGPGLETITVKEALTQGDDSYVNLKGQIVRHLGKDKYLFKDATGEIIIDIDNNKWNGLTITPSDVIEIKGEIDKDWTSLEIDVDYISKIG
jgi:uncharacterized protein (TIGR00156 family)